MLLEKDKFLAPLTTFQIGGSARYFILVQNLKDLGAILELQQQNSCPIFILGGGSNLLIQDKGWDGIVVKLNLDYLEIREENQLSPNSVSVKVGAGRLMPQLVSQMCSLGLRGLEWAGGLPGTVGGAVRGNAGCFGGEIKDSVTQVIAFNLKTKDLKNFNNGECEFLYRHSFFKKNEEWLIVEIILSLQKGEKAELLKLMQEKIQYRQDHHPLELPNAGSIFKNIFYEQAPPALQTLAKEKNILKPASILKIPAAFAIESCQLKGRAIGGAKISEKHANFIVNYHRAKARDVLDLIDLVKETARQKFELTLEEEIQIV